MTRTLRHEGNSVREFLRGLFLHRRHWVRCAPGYQNALPAMALANGLRRGSSLWSESGQQAIASLPLATHAAHRRSELQAMYVRFAAEIEQLSKSSSKWI